MKRGLFVEARVQSRRIYIVIDVLKPHQPSLPEFAVNLKKLDGVEKVVINLKEIDNKTKSLKVILEGNIEYESLRVHLTKLGAEIKSIDQVVIEPKSKSANKTIHAP
jgi:hypothetical protein